MKLIVIFEINTIYIYSSIAVLILIIVSLNYMNLSAALSFHRYKEVGLRKVVGANRKQLFKQFLGESFLVTIVSFILSFILIVLLLPVFKNITGIPPKIGGK